MKKAKDSATKRFHQAVLKGDIEAAIAIYESHTIDDARLRHSFDRAAEKGLTKLVAYLIRKGCDFHLRTGDQRPGDAKSDVDWITPLQLAVANGHYETAELLLEAGAPPDGGMTYWTPLLDAGGNERMCRLLLDHGATETVFTLVAGGRNVRVRELAAAELDLVHVRDEFNRTPLFFAENLTMVQLLIELGADVNAADNRRNSVLSSLLGGHYDPEHDDEADRELLPMVQALVAAGADVNARNKRKVTPLHRACRRANLPVVRELVRLGAKVNAKDSVGETPLFRVVNKPAEQEIVRFLLESGADDTIETRRGKTPSSIAKGVNRRLLDEAWKERS